MDCLTFEGFMIQFINPNCTPPKVPLPPGVIVAPQTHCNDKLALGVASTFLGDKPTGKASNGKKKTGIPEVDLEKF